MDERELLERLRRLEALRAGGATAGERGAAAAAAERLREQRRTAEPPEPAVEYALHTTDQWSCRLLSALMRRHGLKPYRYSRQRYTTVMAMVPKKFLDEVLWPQYQEMSSLLRSHLDEVAERIVAQTVQGDNADPEVRPEPARLSSGAR